MNISHSVRSGEQADRTVLPVHLSNPTMESNRFGLRSSNVHKRVINVE